MFVITDGIPSDTMNTTMIQQMHDFDITLIIIGVGSGVKVDNLIELAGGQNYSSNVYSLNNWDLIVNMINNL